MRLIQVISLVVAFISCTLTAAYGLVMGLTTTPHLLFLVPTNLILEVVILDSLQTLLTNQHGYSKH